MNAMQMKKTDSQNNVAVMFSGKGFLSWISLFKEFDYFSRFESCYKRKRLKILKEKDHFFLYHRWMAKKREIKEETILNVVKVAFLPATSTQRTVMAIANRAAMRAMPFWSRPIREASSEGGRSLGSTTKLPRK